jgi:hypothetical protein
VSIVALAAVVVGAYAGLVGAMYGFQRQLLYFPSSGPLDAARAGVPEMRTVTLQTDDGLALQSWYAAAQGKAATVVYFHGNGGHIGHRGPKVRPYLDAGFGVLQLSYRGYGSNPGRPTEEGLYADGRAALAFLAGEGVPRNRTVFYGESLGSGVAVELAQGTPIAALVLESPFTSVPDVARHHYPFVPAGLLVRDRFDSASKIARTRAPLLVLHGEKDRVVPIRYGRALFAAANEPKEFHAFPEADHNDLHEFGLSREAIGFLQLRGLGR